MTTTPDFSFVATSRNDDHGGDVLRRTQSFINRLSEQCKRHEVAAELVLVDWNPPRNRAPLVDVLGWPAGHHWFSARVVTVPPTVHSQLRYSSRLAMFQMIAKNVGIRRALGGYIIATNIDIIFSDELFQWLKSGDKREGVLYRSDRWDIPNEIQLEEDLNTLLQRARREAIRHNLKDGTRAWINGALENITPDRFESIVFDPLLVLLRRAHDKIERKELLGALDELINVQLPNRRREYFIPQLHTNGCGDFSMLSRNDWFALRGYPEWSIFSWMIDSVLVFQAYYNGLECQDLDHECVHYHVEHDYGSGWTPEGANELWARLNERRVPYISHEQWLEIVYELQGHAAADLFTVYNQENWGMSSVDFNIRSMTEPRAGAREPIAVNQGTLDEDFFTIAMETPFEFTTFSCPEGTESEYHEDYGPRPSIMVTSRPELWAHAIEWDLRSRKLQGEYWFEIRLRVHKGAVSACILDQEGTKLLIEKIVYDTSTGQHCVRLPVKDIAKASRLILRNACSDGSRARFSIDAVRLLIDPSPDMRNGLEVPPQGGIVSWIGRTEQAPDYPDGKCQLMIMTPPEPGSIGAIMKFSAAAPRRTELALDLHVLVGTASISVLSVERRLLVEKQEPAGAPMTRIHFDFAEDVNPAAIVVSNASVVGPTRLLMHSIAVSS